MSEYQTLNEEQMDYIASKFGDSVTYLLKGFIGSRESSNVQAPRETNNWFYAIPEDGYLVKMNDEFGFLYEHLEYHDGQSVGAGRRKALIHGKRTSESVLSLLIEAAKEINQKEIGCEVFVGENAGMNYEHVLSVFIQEGYETTEVSQIIEASKQLISELTLAKWNSLVDLVALR